MNIKPIKNNLKGAQRLTGCLAALGHFISCLGERRMPLYKHLKKSKQFQWIEEVQQAVDLLKDFLTTPPVLVSLAANETILLYITVTTKVVRAALVVEHKEGHNLEVHRPVYFISEILSNQNRVCSCINNMYQRADDCKIR